MKTQPKTLMEPIEAYGLIGCVGQLVTVGYHKESLHHNPENGESIIPVTITDTRPEAVAEMVERAASTLVSYDADAKWPDDFSPKDVAEARRMAAKCFAEFFCFYPDAPTEE